MKKYRISIYILLIVIVLSSFSFAEGQDSVYVVPVNGEINKATYNFLKEKTDEIYKKKAKAIIFEIDTYGGQINEAEKIKNLIVSAPIPTIAYVNNKAESAGVLITIAAENVVISTSGTIGSAETIPNTEKVLSMWRSFLRDTAQFRDRDFEVIEAMADKDISIEGLTEKGKLVNLTSKEALEYGIADLASDDYNEIIEHFNLGKANIIKVDEGLQMKLAKIISNPYISSFLLSLGFIGMAIEILTPGFGLGGTLSVIGFGLYFGGNILAGNSQWISLALFVLGLILLVIEVIVPGFGLPGISGILFVALGVVLAMDSLPVAMMSLSVAIITTTIVTVILIKLGHRSKIFDRVILSNRHESEKGYLSTDSNYEYMDKEGISLTNLRPSGFIEINGLKLDAISDGELISQGEEVKVVRVEGSKIFVRRV